MESGENHCRRRELGWQKKNQDSMMKGFRNNHLPSVVVPPNPVARQFRAEEDVPREIVYPDIYCDDRQYGPTGTYLCT